MIYASLNAFKRIGNAKIGETLRSWHGVIPSMPNITPKCNALRYEYAMQEPIIKEIFQYAYERGVDLQYGLKMNFLTDGGINFEVNFNKQDIKNIKEQYDSYVELTKETLQEIVINAPTQ